MNILHLQDSAPGHGASSSFSAHENKWAASFPGAVLAAQVLVPSQSDLHLMLFVWKLGCMKGTIAA